MLTERLQPAPHSALVCAGCRRPVVLDALAGRLVAVEPDGSERLHPCTRGPAALVAVDGDVLEVVPRREHLDVVLEVLRGRLSGPAGALKAVVGRLLDAGVVPVMTATAEVPVGDGSQARHPDLSRSAPAVVAAASPRPVIGPPHDPYYEIWDREHRPRILAALHQRSGAAGALRPVADRLLEAGIIPVIAAEAA